MTGLGKTRLMKKKLKSQLQEKKRCDHSTFLDPALSHICKVVITQTLTFDLIKLG